MTERNESQPPRGIEVQDIVEHATQGWQGKVLNVEYEEDTGRGFATLETPEGNVFENVPLSELVLVSREEFNK